MPTSSVNAPCAECGGGLLPGPFGPHCPRCAFALAASHHPRAEAKRVSEALLQERFPEYRFIEQIGQGGFGVVYRVEHRRLQRSAAMKLLAEPLTRAIGAIVRFEREMAAAGRLDHPGIVRAFDAGERGGQWFLTMEFVEGLDLGAISSTLGPLSPADACELIRQAAVALDYAHRRGLIHRDVKPGNLMLAHGEPAPTVKVLDFGLAAISESGVSELTHSGEFLGTVEYIAPELLQSRQEINARADVYGLGATLHRLLTATAPHKAGGAGESLVQKLLRIAAEKPAPMAALRPDLPAGLADLCDRLLAQKPLDRPASAAEVAELLSPYCSNANLKNLLERTRSGSLPGAAVKDSSAPAPSNHQLPPKRQRFLAGLALLVLALGGAAWWHFQRFVPVKDGPLTFLEPGWHWLRTLDTTPHARFARFRPYSEELYFSDGMTGLYRENSQRVVSRLSDQNLFNGAFLAGPNPKLICTIHNPPLVERWQAAGASEPVDIPFAVGEHPWGIAVIPPGWKGGHGLLPGDALVGSGLESGSTHLWRLRSGETAVALPDVTELPPGVFDMVATPNALYFACWGSKADPPEDDSIWRMDSGSFEPVVIDPPIAKLAPGPRGPLCLACDPARGDLIISLPAKEKTDPDPHTKLFHLRPAGADGRRFKATPFVEGLSDTARFGLAFSGDGHRLAIVDDRAEKIHLLERR